MQLDTDERQPQSDVTGTDRRDRQEGQGAGEESSSWLHSHNLGPSTGGQFMRSVPVMDGCPLSACLATKMKTIKRALGTD